MDLLQGAGSIDPLQFPVYEVRSGPERFPSLLIRSIHLTDLAWHTLHLLEKSLVVNGAVHGWHCK